MENINQIRQLTLRVKEYLVSLSTDPPETILDIESIERHVDRLALLVSVDEEEEEESEEEDYKAFGVMGENSDCEEDLGFFDSMVAATVCFEDAVKDGEYDHVFIFDTNGYNPEYDNAGTVSIIREFKKETDEEEETDEADEPKPKPVFPVCNFCSTHGQEAPDGYRWIEATPDPSKIQYLDGACHCCSAEYSTASMKLQLRFLTSEKESDSDEVSCATAD